MKKANENLSLFQSTPSVGRATITVLFFDMLSATFQSTPSVGRATTKPGDDYTNREIISIHALRGEGDVP